MKRVLLTVMAAALVACDPGPTEPDAGEVEVDAGQRGPGPTLLASSPANGATGVSTTVSIVLEFSEAVDRGSFLVKTTPNFLVSQPLFEFDDTVVTLTPVTPLEGGIDYLVQGTAKDLEGNVGAYALSFGAEAPDSVPPTLTGKQPSGADAGAALDAPIILTFSESMDSATVTASVLPAADLDGPTWNEDETVATFVPVAPWVKQKTYQVAVEGEDVAGNQLGGMTTFSFTTLTPTDTTPPTLIASSPAPNATLVPRNAIISIVFSEPMLTATVEPAISSLPKINCAFTWSPDNDAVTCTPTAPLTASTKYTVGIAASAQDSQANPLGLAAAASFTTSTVTDSTPPALSTFMPANMATGVARASPLVLTFSEAMDVASTSRALTVTGGAGGADVGKTTWDVTRKVMTFTPSAPFPYGTQVTWQLAATAKDVAGNPMAGGAQGTWTVIRSGTMDLPATQSGHVSTNLTVCTTCSSLIIGDNATNRAYRALFNFDLNALPASATKIVTASFNVYQASCDGNPYTALGAINVESVNYGTTITVTAYSSTALNPTPAKLTSTSCGVPRWQTVPVTAFTTADFAAKATRAGRSQYRVRFNLATNSNSAQDRILVPSHLVATDKPYLRVVYEYP